MLMLTGRVVIFCHVVVLGIRVSPRVCHIWFTIYKIFVVVACFLEINDFREMRRTNTTSKHNVQSQCTRARTVLK